MVVSVNPKLLHELLNKLSGLEQIATMKFRETLTDRISEAPREALDELLLFNSQVEVVRYWAPAQDRTLWF